MIGSGFIAWVGLTWSALMTGIASFFLFISQDSVLLTKNDYKNYTCVQKGVVDMMLSPGVAGWLATMASGSVQLFNFIRLFLPIFGE